MTDTPTSPDMTATPTVVGEDGEEDFYLTDANGRRIPDICNPHKGAEPRYDLPAEWYSVSAVLINSEQLMAMALPMPVPGEGLEVAIDMSPMSTVGFCRCGQCSAADPERIAEQFTQGNAQQYAEQGLTLIAANALLISDKLDLKPLDGMKPMGFIDHESNRHDLRKEGLH